VASQRAGRWVAQLEGYRAYLPAPLPPRPALRWDDALARSLSQADHSIGRLDGASRFLPDADLFLAMYVRREALLSSQIEGTDCTLDDVLAFELDRTATNLPTLDVGEVVNYIAAMQHGLTRLDELPLSSRLLREIHGRLLAEGRGSHKTPGEFRRTQNWIGPPNCTLAQATFVPPPPSEMHEALSALERFLHDTDLPVLVTAGLAHAQFETIHPFLDGNGRVGRLLVTLLLCERGVLRRPVLYLSTYLKRYRSEYFQRLTAVRREGDWEAWLAFFLRGVTAAADEATATAEAVHDLHNTARARVVDAGGSGLDFRVLDALYAQPLVNAKWVTDVAGVVPATANKILARLEAAGIVREITGRKRDRVFRYDAYLALYDQPVTDVTADETHAANASSISPNS
jgi:Fic family protein